MQFQYRVLCMLYVILTLVMINEWIAEPVADMYWDYLL